jgi:ParB family chromosome partitioning protein
MSADKKKRSALGMGIEALIPDRLQSDFFLCPVEEIRPSGSQPRKHFEVESLEELAQSIREKGVIQPLVLRKLPMGAGYELIAGERRWRAAQKAGLTEVPAILRKAEADEVLELALVENLQREDLNPLDEARAFKLLLDSTGSTQEEVAERIGKSRVAVANSLRLLALPDEALEALRAGVISAGHGRAILAVSPERRIAFLRVIVAKGATVREAEALAKKPARKAKTAAPRRDADLRALEDRLAKALGARVTLKPGKKKGSGAIAIRYQSFDDLDRILSIMEGR